MNVTLALLASYLIGSIPSGLWLGMAAKGVDIRQHGSQNIGATNALRVLGKGYGIAALAADVGKGFLAVYLGGLVSAWPHAPLLCGVVAIIGHSASIFCKFNGGKGVATSAGVFLALAPWATLIAVAAFLAVVLATRMVSAGSMAAAVALAVAMGILPHTPMLRWITAGVAVLVIVRHRSNIRRILKGEESKLWGGN